MATTNIVEFFCILDELCKYFAPELKKRTLKSPPVNVTVTLRAVCQTVRL